MCPRVFAPLTPRVEQVFRLKINRHFSSLSFFLLNGAMLRQKIENLQIYVALNDWLRMMQKEAAFQIPK